MASNLSSSWKKWGRHWRGQSDHVSRCSISSNIVFVCAELTSFGSDTLQVFLCRGIGITDLKQKSLLADGLAMELLDNLLADITVFETFEENGLSARHGEHC